MAVITDNERIEDVVTSRYISAVYPSADAVEGALKRGERLSFYLGIDPTGPQLHLGHSVQLLMLRQLQELGHRVIFLIGDFTGRVGDPTGKSRTRAQLTPEEIQHNCRSYKEQAGAVLDFSGDNPVELKYNSEWLAEMGMGEAIELMAHVTVGQMIQRDMFRERMEQGREIYLHEFLYPLLQGYDSVAMNIDGEVGGSDQTFNMLMGRDLLREYNEKEKLVITTKLLEDPETGKKLMSKSEGDYVPLDAEPADMFGRVMALPDSAIMPVFELCTRVDDERIEEAREMTKTDPRGAKAQLAGTIVEMYHGAEAAERAANEFDRVFREGEKPADIPEVAVAEQSMPLADLLVEVGLAGSKSEAKRLVEQGGVTLDGERKTDWSEHIQIPEGGILRAGKRRFVRLTVA